MREFREIGLIIELNLFNGDDGCFCGVVCGVVCDDISAGVCDAVWNFYGGADDGFFSCVSYEREGFSCTSSLPFLIYHVVSCQDEVSLSSLHDRSKGYPFIIK